MAVTFVVEGVSYEVGDDEAADLARLLRVVAADEDERQYWAPSVAVATLIELALWEERAEPIAPEVREGDALLHVLDADDARCQNPSELHRALRRWLGHPEFWAPGE